MPEEEQRHDPTWLHCRYGRYMWCTCGYRTPHSSSPISVQLAFGQHLLNVRKEEE